ncbi:MAG: GlsB/YeaQ/YmgE family stress response membrane protein [Actinomycetota bacterium]|nr:GlsB/YeaQ/YmgE family stress response membrane protein [Actinomycetota bacterium]
MGILALIIVGLIAGILAKIATPGPDPGGIVLTIAIGVVGAFIGGFIVSRLGGPDVTGLNLPSILIATLGAIILLAIYRLATRRAA